MVSQNSIALLANGISPRRIAEGRRVQEKRNALEEILNQQAISQNDAALRGIRLDNTAKARAMSTPKTIDPYKQAQIDNLRSQIEERKRKTSQIPNPLKKVPEAARQHLPAEILLNPRSVDPAAFNRAAVAAIGKMKEQAALPSLEQQKFDAKQAETQKQQDKAAGLKDEVVKLATELLNHPQLEANVGAYDGSAVGQFLTFDGESADFQNAYNKLKSILTAENLDLMTGVLSETDIKILSDIAGGGLNLRGSEEAFRKELRNMGGKDLEGNIPEITTKEAFDALPSGSIYTENGVQFRKP